MASSSMGSDVFALLALLVVSVLVLLLLRHYLPLRTTPAYLLVPVFLALALPCSIILLVPIDLASATDGGDGPSRGLCLPERVVLVTWRITYWLTFCLTWFILPFLGEYCDSGYRETRERVVYSLRSNARYQLITLGAGVAGLVYFILQNGFHAASIKGMLIALAYAWGLILAIGLMGHGLVALPRRLLKNASVSGRLRRLQVHAPKLKDKLDDAVGELDNLEDTVWQLKQRKYGTSVNLQEWIDELADTTAIPDSRPGATAAVRATNTNIPAVVTERYLADLTRKLKRARHKKARFVDEWSQLCQQAQDAQTVLDSKANQRLDIGCGRPGSTTFFGRLTFLTPAMRHHLYMTIIPAARVALAVLLATASIMIVFSEVVKFFAPSISIIALTTIHHPSSSGSKVGFAGQIIAAAWLLYMDTCALYAISDVRVWGNRALVKRQTYAEGACWYATQVAKLTVPLSYNFITMLPPDVYKETQFYKFLGQLINLTPLGQGFSAFFPCFLLVPVLMTLFSVYGKMKNVIGFAALEDDEEGNVPGQGAGGWREGRALIDREIQSRSTANGTNDLGLSPRGGSLNQDRRTAGTYTDNAPDRGRRDQQSALPTHIRQSNRQFNAITNREEEEDDNARHFYQDFAERVRNTFDTAERPEFIKNFSFKTPKWLQQDGGGGGGGGGGGSGRGNALSRFFSGGDNGDSNGRLRL